MQYDYRWCWVIRLKRNTADNNYANCLSVGVLPEPRCHSEMNATEQTFTTPNFPHNYFSNYECHWLIRAVPGTIIAHIIHCSSLSLQNSPVMIKKMSMELHFTKCGSALSRCQYDLRKNSFVCGVSVLMYSLAVWLSGNALASINVVALRQTRLVPGWVTVCGRVNHLGM